MAYPSTYYTKSDGAFGKQRRPDPILQRPRGAGMGWNAVVYMAMLR